MSDPLALLGEVRTILLPHSVSLSEPEVKRLLSLLPGQQVSVRKRPLPRAVSPNCPIGIDCDLATVRGQRCRAIGTVSAHAVVVGGRLGQSSVHTRVVRAGKSNRLSWSHYMTELGTVEMIPRVGEDEAAAEELSEGFLEKSTKHTLDLGSISERLLTRVRMDATLDHRLSLRTAPTSLRWTARVVAPTPGCAPARTRFSLRLDDETTRSVRLEVPTVADLQAVQRFCEDLAVHDWLLTALGNALADVDAAPAAQSSVPQLMSLLEDLVHLWMPGAYTPEPMRDLWTGMEADPGFTRQWNAQVCRLRDRVALETLRSIKF